MINGVTPILATSDLEATIKFYKEVLGFDSTWMWGDPPSFGGASRGQASLFFSLYPEVARRSSEQEVWLNVDNVDELYAEHVKCGAKIVSEIADRPWDHREYVVEDPSGYRLRFAAPVSAPSKASTPFPAGVTIDRRVPTQAEYAAVAGATFYKDVDPTEYLKYSWGGVVAFSPEGEPIGTTRIMQDAPGWFSVWDVAVLPDWQSQHIGERMMQESLELIRVVSPGAWVFLFTNKQGFYEKLGFGEQKVTMRKV